MSSWKIAYYIAAAALTILWMVLCLKGKGKYTDRLEEWTDTPFMKPMFGIGLAVLDLIGYQCNTPARRKKLQQIREVEDARKAENCLLMLRAGEITYLLTFLPMGLCLAILADKAEAAILGPVLAISGAALLERSYANRVRAKRDEVLNQLPAVLSKLVLLMNSGMILRDAWKMVSMRGNGMLYEEMQRVSEDIRNGHMEIEAYRSFSERCSGQEVRKFIGIILQNLSKGNDELLRYLTDLSTEMWNVKKNRIQKKADSAVQKLLFPMALVFCMVLVMIVVPMLSGIGF